jgi:hypothetical protein
MYLISRIHFLVLFAAAIVLGGCQEPETQADQVSIDGIKITDIAPETIETIPHQIVFRILTFEVPSEQIDLLQETFRAMSKRQIQFADRDAFDANGFLAGFGTQQEWPAFSGGLEKAISRRTATRNVVVYEAAGDDIAGSMLNSSHDVAWIAAGGKTSRETFAVGRFAWMLKARPLESIRGVAQVQIVPVYRIGTRSLLAHLASVSDFTAFPASAISIRMSPGDYVLLGSAGEPVSRDGRPIAPLTLNRLLFYPAERPGMLRLFLVMCAGIEE